MVLIRKLVLRCLQFNIRIFCKWIQGALNFRADFLSRQKLDAFHSYVKKYEIEMEPEPTPLHPDLWPASKLWSKDN